MILSTLRQRWFIIMLAGATLVSATLGIRQVFGLFLEPISVELDTGFQLFSLAIAVQNLVNSCGWSARNDQLCLSAYFCQRPGLSAVLIFCVTFSPNHC